MSKQKLTEKQQMQLQFLSKLTAAIAEVFDEESDLYIGELTNENITDFIHVLATGVPNHFYGKLTGSDVNQLEFNHIANKLCFQFGKMKD